MTELTDAVRRVGNGGSVVDPAVVARLLGRLRPNNSIDGQSDRERAVLSLMAEGRSNAAIAARLFLGERTVESHVHNIFGRLGLEDTPDDHRRVLAVVAYLRG